VIKEIINFVDSLGENWEETLSSEKKVNKFPKHIFRIYYNKDGNLSYEYNPNITESFLKKLIIFSSSLANKSINSTQGVMATNYAAFYPFNKEALYKSSLKWDDFWGLYKSSSYADLENNNFNFILDREDRLKTISKLNNMPLQKLKKLNKYFEKIYVGLFNKTDILKKLEEIYTNLQNKKKMKKEVLFYCDKNILDNLKEKLALNINSDGQMYINFTIKGIYNFRNKYFLIFNKAKETHIGRCSICNKKALVSYPDFLTTYNTKKRYRTHQIYTLSPNLEFKNRKFFCCVDCLYKLKKFTKYIKNRQVKIFPLFISKETAFKEIKLINKYGFNSFKDIMEKLSNNENIFDFYLMILIYSNINGKWKWSPKYFDYIENYKWYLDSYFDLDNNSYKPYKKKVNRYVILSLLNIKTYYLISYFFDSSLSDKQLPPEHYILRSQIFDFIYRDKKINCNKRELLVKLSSMSDFYLNKYFKKKVDYINLTKHITNFRIFYLNRELFTNINIKKGENMDLIDRNKIIEKIKDYFESGSKYIKLDDFQTLYFLGVYFRYLVENIRNSKRDLLLEGIVNSNNLKQLKLQIQRMFERASPNLSNNNILDCLGNAALLNFITILEENKIDFREYKLIFYSGYFDKNIIDNLYKYNNISKKTKVI
jgi:hypothetical protein